MQIHQVTQISEAHAEQQFYNALRKYGCNHHSTTIVEAAKQKILSMNLVCVLTKLQLPAIASLPLTFWYKYYSSLEDIKYLYKKKSPLASNGKACFIIS
jgi:hypothetical protein